MRLPKNHLILSQLKDKKGNIYYVTAVDNNRDKYFLWLVKGKEVEKITTSIDPLKFDKMIFKDKKNEKSTES